MREALWDFRRGRLINQLILYRFLLEGCLAVAVAVVLSLCPLFPWVNASPRSLSPPLFAMFPRFSSPCSSSLPHSLRRSPSSSRSLYTVSIAFFPPLIFFLLCLFPSSCRCCLSIFFTFSLIFSLSSSVSISYPRSVLLPPDPFITPATNPSCTHPPTTNLNMALRPPLPPLLLLLLLFIHFPPPSTHPRRVSSLPSTTPTEGRPNRHSKN